MAMANEQAEQAELRRLLEQRLELVNSDPEYIGDEPTAGDQLIMALVGLIAPAALMIGGWIVYG